MNINLDYEGKNYNFDIPKDAKLEYLKDLSCKLFKSDKKLLELICNNHKIIQKDDNIFIQDLIPKGKNSTILTVQMGEENKKDKLDNQKVLNPTKNNKIIKIKKIDLNQENNDIKNTTKKNYSNNTIQINDNKSSQIFENKIFIANYIKKSNELFSMMKDFNDKIKEIDNNLNRKMKNFDSDCENNIFYYELSLFEKRIIDFQKRQINYYKELIKLLSINDQETKEPNFDLLYSKLLLNEDNLERNDKNKFPKISNKSVKKSINDFESDLFNVLPMIKKGNKKLKEGLIISNDLELIKDKENKDIFRTIEQRNYSNKNNQIKLKNLGLNKINIKTENKSNFDSLGGKNEIKYRNDEKIKKKYTENSINNYNKKNLIFN